MTTPLLFGKCFGDDHLTSNRTTIKLNAFGLRRKYLKRPITWQRVFFFHQIDYLPPLKH